MQAKAYDSFGRRAAIAVIGACLFLGGCVAHGQPVATVDAPAAAVVEAPQAVVADATPEVEAPRIVPVVFQTGTASYYARRFDGRRTASGERYDMNALSAAHRTLPLGSYVRVTDLRNKRSVVVRVNDRGPFVKDRVIDLSFAAATLIGLRQSGHAPVSLERVSAKEAQTPPVQKIRAGLHKNKHKRHGAKRKHHA